MISHEQTLIAAVMLDPRVLRAAIDECVPADFEDQRLGAIWGGFAELVREGVPISVLAVADRLAAWDVRGITAADLWTWTNEVTTPEIAAYAASQVREGGMRRGLVEVGVRTQQAARSQTDVGVALAAAAAELAALRDRHVVVRAEARSLQQILDEHERDVYDWTIPGVLERGERMVLTGSEGGGKSTLVRQMAVMAAAGLQPFTFYGIPAMRVLVVDAENSTRQWARKTRALVKRAGDRGSARPADQVRVWCAPRLDLTRDADLGEVHRLMDEHAPDIVFIGPLYRLTPRAINDDDTAAVVLAALDTIVQRNVSMVVEAHAGHAAGASGDRDLRPRGSAALMGWPDFGMGLRPDKKARERDTFELVRWRGDRDERQWPFALRRGASEWPWTATEFPPPVEGSR